MVKVSRMVKAGLIPRQVQSRLFQGTSRVRGRSSGELVRNSVPEIGRERE
jgi:hypothetical protein